MTTEVASTVDGPRSGPENEDVRGSWLLVFEGQTTRRLALPAGEFFIGRSEECGLRLEDPRASRQHARITLSDTDCRVADLASQNGTLLNDVALVGESLFASGDVLVVGGTTIVFHEGRGRRQRTPTVLDPMVFRSRAEVELERARRFSRPLSLLDVAFSSPVDRARLQPLLQQALRAIDFATWSADHLCALLPEADETAAEDLASNLLQALEAAGAIARAGLARYPDDAPDLSTLQSVARAAALKASPLEVGLADSTVSTLEIGAQRVVVADGVMVRLFELVRRLAKSDLPILIQGETGTGKEVVASALHAFSPRASRRMLAVNCAAFQESLLESELFGHERGAFTGATSQREGLFEAAQGGTVFLDELGEMSPALQAKLLRTLENKRITRVGDTREREVDFRVVAATHRDLAAEVKAGRFREDLYFRLLGATLWLPPLRDRPRELPIMARLFLENAFRQANRPAPVLSSGALHHLGSHAWPGNVRELKNVMEFLAATVETEVVESWHLDGRLAPPSASPSAQEPSSPGTMRPLAEEIMELERRRMLQALDSNRWNQTRAAAVLDMPLRTFVTRFKAYDLQRERK